MPKQKVNLNNFTESLAGLLKYEKSMQATNEIEYRKLLKVMSKVISGELTLRQKECLTLRYYSNLTICQIASELSINKSTASRHISRAKFKIKRLLEYYME